MIWLTVGSIRLATHLYAEHLIDRDHYMDWLVAGLENSNQTKLPMWLLIVQIYWKDLLKLRRHGRRLVSAILSHHASVGAPRAAAFECPQLTTPRFITTPTGISYFPFRHSYIPS